MQTCLHIVLDWSRTEKARTNCTCVTCSASLGGANGATARAPRKQNCCFPRPSRQRKQKCFISYTETFRQNWISASHFANRLAPRPCPGLARSLGEGIQFPFFCRNEIRIFSPDMLRGPCSRVIQREARSYLSHNRGLLHSFAEHAFRIRRVHS